jgi:hypothetical protein
MTNGNKPADGGHLLLSLQDVDFMRRIDDRSTKFIRRFVGAEDSIQGKQRFCLWVSDNEASEAATIEPIAARISCVREMRLKSKKEFTRRGASTPHAFQQVRQAGDEIAMVVPRHSSEGRAYLPITMFPSGAIVADGAFALYDAPLWNFGVLVSRLHLVWVAAVCGKIKTDYRYSSTLGWNTFPLPTLTAKNKADMTSCAEDILLAREAHFPATIADLYNPEDMPANLHDAHEHNDEVLERIYMGRRFRNDTERLEKLFELYTKMTAGLETTKKKRKAGSSA